MKRKHAEVDDDCTTKKPNPFFNEYEAFLAVSAECRQVFSDLYAAPHEVTEIIMRYVWMDPIVRRSEEIEREKLVCWKKFYNGMESEENFKDEKKHGVCKGFTGESLMFEYHHKDGKKHGVCKEWYSGVWNEWYEKGVQKWEENYKEGKKHGVWKSWYKNGTLKWEHTYKDGQNYGVWKEWSNDGTLAFKISMNK